MHYPDYVEDYFNIYGEVEEDEEDVLERLADLAPYLLLNRFLAMDYDKMPEMQKIFAHLGPLVKKLTLRDVGSYSHKFNSTVGKIAGQLLLEYCENGTIKDRDLKMNFGMYDDNRAKVYQLAKYLKNLKTLDCYKVRDKWGNFPVQRITQYCPKLERLVVVCDFIDKEDFNIGLIIPQHSTLKIIKINMQAYNHSGIATKIFTIGKKISENTPNVQTVEITVEIDAYLEHWTYVQEKLFLSQFREHNDMYLPFKLMNKLKRWKVSYSFLYEGVATLDVKVK